MNCVTTNLKFLNAEMNDFITFLKFYFLISLYVTLKKYIEESMVSQKFLSSS